MIAGRFRIVDLSAHGTIAETEATASFSKSNYSYYVLFTSTTAPIG